MAGSGTQQSAVARGHGVGAPLVRQHRAPARVPPRVGRRPRRARPRPGSPARCGEEEKKPSCVQPTPELHSHVAAAGPGGSLRRCGGTFNLSGPLSIPCDLTITGASTTVLAGQGERFGTILKVAAGKTVRVANVACTGGTGSPALYGPNREIGGGVCNADGATLLLAGTVVVPTDTPPHPPRRARGRGEGVTRRRRRAPPRAGRRAAAWSPGRRRGRGSCRSARRSPCRRSTACRSGTR